VNLPAGAVAATLFLDALLEDLPYILAHLRGDEQAMTLAQVIREGQGGEDETIDEAGPQLRDEVEKPNASPTAMPSGKGLNAEEFAAFLRRNKEGNT